MPPQVEFEVLKSEKKSFGKNNFIEVARKKAKTATGENEFISITRGYYLPDGTERFKKSVSVPIDQDLRDFIAENIKSI